MQPLPVYAGVFRAGYRVANARDRIQDVGVLAIAEGHVVECPLPGNGLDGNDGVHADLSLLVQVVEERADDVPARPHGGVLVVPRLIPPGAECGRKLPDMRDALIFGLATVPSVDVTKEPRVEERSVILNRAVIAMQVLRPRQPQ